MNIRIDPELKEKLYKLARAEGKPAGRMVRDIIAEYVKDRDIGTYVDNLWDKIGDNLRSRRIGTEDVHKAIRETRRARG